MNSHNVLNITPAFIALRRNAMSQFSPLRKAAQALFKPAAIAAGLAGALLASNALAFTSGSTGADGALAPTVGTVVVQVPESGILNYTTINIPTGVTVKFKKNTLNTPVFVLVSG